MLVFHFGGETYDVTLLTLDDGLFEVVATGGDPHLGEESTYSNGCSHLSHTWPIQ